jgi:2',3'-cyclic-nucleotide 2'-phosphodiesterase (5'-nucleotidase family)
MIRSVFLLRFIAGLLFFISLPITYYLLDQWHLQLSLLRIVVVVSLLMVVYVYLLLVFFTPEKYLWRKGSTTDNFWLLNCIFILLALIFFGVQQWPASLKNDNKIRVTLLQINDVYEIVPLDEGKTGGLARVAAIRDSLAKENPTFTVVAGDFLSPSVIGNLKDNNGQKLLGLQMVDVLNTVGVDLVTFGNHEFDLDRNQLQKCIDASIFNWVSANTGDSLSTSYRRNFSRWKGNNGTPVPLACIKEFTDADGTKFTIGFFGLTIATNAGKYVLYKDYEQATRTAIAALKGRCDAIVALTHLTLSQDSMIASRFPEINLIIGGHEHVNSYNIIDSTPIAKADANVRTVYVHTLEYDKESKALSISSVLKAVDASITANAATNTVVKKWNLKADSLLKKKYRPCHAVATLTEDFDGTGRVRQGPTNLTLAIARAMAKAVTNNPPSCAIYNSGTIRLEDMLRGTVTEYDVLRTFPYNDSIYVATFPGFLLKRLLDTSANNKTDGCFLQYDSCISQGPNKTWLFNGKEIKNNAGYRVAINGYLLRGDQSKMEFIGNYTKQLKIDTPKAGDLLRQDMKAALISYLGKMYPPKSQEKESKIVPCYDY